VGTSLSTLGGDGDDGAGGKPSAAGMVQEELPRWLDSLSQLLKEKKVFKKDFNHVLINEYEPGQGIMVRPHRRLPSCSPEALVGLFKVLRAS
jgi:hypothetical protein